MDSPISLLSTELVALILDHLLVDCAVANGDPIACGPEDDTVAASSKIIQSPAQVSTYWRSICLGNPLLWSNISIVHPWSLEEIEKRLERSQECALDLRIFGHIGYTTRTRKDIVPHYPPPHLPTLDMYTDLFELIFPVLKRCRVLHVRGVFADENRVLPTHALKRMVDAPMPILEHLTWEGELNNFTEELSRLGCDAFFRYAPKLQQLRLVGIDVNRVHFPSSGPFQASSSPSLTTLHLSRGSSSAIEITLTQLTSILQTYSSLSTLAIYDDILTTDDIGSVILHLPCTVPSLKSLYILGNMLSVSQLLIFLQAPNMAELVIAPTVHTDLEVLLKNDIPVNSHQDIISADATPSTIIKSREDRFPKLTSLTLAPAYPQDMMHTLFFASECFPLIERLVVVLPPQGYLVKFLNSFSPAILASNGIHKLTFPHLKDLALHLDLDPSLPPHGRSACAVFESENPTNSKTRPSQCERVSRWAKAIHEILHIRDTQLNVPLNNIFVDDGTFRAFECLDRYCLGNNPDSERKDTSVSGEILRVDANSQFGDMPPVKMANFWEDQRRKMLFTPIKDLFLGSVGEGF